MKGLDWNGRRHRSRGSAMVELALSVGLLVPSLTGTFQFGYAFYTYNRLIVAVRGGARYASLRTYDSSTSTPSDNYLAAVKNVVVYGNPVGGSEPVVPGLSTAQVAVSVTMTNNTPDTIVVSLASFTVNTVVKTMTWSGKPAAAFRFEGRYSP